MPLSDADQTTVRDAVTQAVLQVAPGDLDTDPAASLRLLEACRLADLQTRQLLADAVDGARGAGHSWDTVGRALGTTRQAAQQRFGEERAAAAEARAGRGSSAPAGDGDPGADAPADESAGDESAGDESPGDESTGQPERKVLKPLTVFDEMAALKDAGEHGWHLVDYGTLHHVVEASPWQWEHTRAPWSPMVASRMAEDGWALIRTITFPWGYYTRQTEVPALPET